MLEEHEASQNSEQEVEQESEQQGIAAEAEEFTPSYQNVANQVDEDNAVDDIVSDLLESGEFTEEEIDELANLTDEELDMIIEEEDFVEDDETETSESEEEDGTPRDEETDDIDDLLTNRVQKRIDKLTAQNKSKDEELELLKVKLTELESKLNQGDTDTAKEDVLDDKQLAEAIARGLEDNDYSVIVDAMNYVAQQTKKSVLKEQEEAQKAQMTKIQKQNAEWNEIVNDYSPSSYRNDLLKNDPDFDITNKDGKLYRLSTRLFVDKNLANEEKGQSKAVREAYSILLENKLTNRKKPGPKASSETEGLRGRLAKEQRKKSLLSGDDSDGDTSPIASASDEDELAAYIASRTKSKEANLGVSF